MQLPISIVSDAVFSPCGLYRYALRRFWAPDLPYVLFIGLNPNTADHARNDPTIRRCIGFARDWGYGGVAVANLFGRRAPKPALLKAADDPVGEENDLWIDRLTEGAGLALAAWGTAGALRGRDTAVASRLPLLHCLGLTKHGAPRHPLYVPAACRPVPYILHP